MKDCIVNVAHGDWYPSGQDRLRRSLEKVVFSGDLLFWKNEFLCGRSHAEFPYGFKAFSMDEARKQGYKRVLWLDAAFIVVKPVAPFFDYIDEVGYFFMDNPGFNTGEWCSDAALGPLKLEREDSFNWPHCMSGILGLNFNRQVCHDFLDEWVKLAADGQTFKDSGSTDKRVRGHRHDQTAASIVSKRLGMKWENPFNWMVYPGWDMLEEQMKAALVIHHNGSMAFRNAGCL